MPGTILLLLESVAVREEAMRYALELAARTEASLAVLLALPFEAAAAAGPGEEWAAGLEAAVRDELRLYATAAQAVGVKVEATMRVGDQVSEVAKYLAGARDVRTVVWGGPTAVTARPSHARAAHWLARLKPVLDCPLVVPARRVRPAQTGSTS